MPTLAMPRTDLDRTLVLEAAVKVGIQDTAAGRTYIAPAWLKKTDIFVADFGPKVRRLAELKANRGREVLEKDAALETLQLYARHFCNVLEMRIIRLKQPDSLFTLYNLPRSGESPNISQAKYWLELARGLIAADATAVGQGFPPMVNPSAAELQTLLESAQKEYDEVPMADRAIDDLQTELDTLRPQADKLIKALNAQLEAALYELPDEGIRRVTRTYGFDFYTRPGEAVETPDDTVATDQPPVPA